jgi:hypothetical protein
LNVAILMNTASASRLVLACALLLGACSASATDGPVAIKTATHSGGVCQIVGWGGVLVADPTWGLAVMGTEPGSDEPPNSHRFGVVWPPGYTARREQGVVVVLDAEGRVAAREGQTMISGNPPTSDGVVHPCAPIEIVPPTPWHAPPSDGGRQPAGLAWDLSTAAPRP